MNQVGLVGRLTAKPELRYTGSNIPYTRFTVAVNRTFSNSQGEREADFISILVWRRQAENAVNYLDKGSQVAVTGRIQTGSYTGQDGQRRFTTDVVADNVQFIGSRRSETSTSNNNYSAPAQTTGPSPYDFEEATPSNNGVDTSVDPFADFGDNVSIDDNFLD